MKVAMISDYYPKYGAKVVQNIIKYSESSDIDFFVISSTYNQLGNTLPQGLSFEDDIKVYRIKSMHMHFSGTPYVFPYKILLDFNKIIKKEKPDIIHAHFLGCVGTWISTYMGKKDKIPIVLTSHGILEGYSKLILTIGSKVMRLPIKYCLKKSNQITTISKRTKDYLLNTYSIPTEKIKVISNGVDINVFKPYKEEKEMSFDWSNSKNIVIGFIGHIRYAKGLQFFIQSAKRIIDESNNEVVFVIAGEGPMKEDLIDMVKSLNLEKYFIFPGYIPDDMLPVFFNSLDIFVQPSLVEGMPQGVLEVMACGKPIVATNVGGVSEIVQNNKNGFLINPASPDEIAKKILKILSDQNLMKKFGNNSRKIVEEKFDWNVLCGEYLRVYRSVIMKDVRGNY